jgi:hypothetical protein
MLVLGNTLFLFSALQAVRAVTQLTA